MDCKECNNLEKLIAEKNENLMNLAKLGGSYSVNDVVKQEFPREIEDLKKELDAHRNSPYCRRVRV
jgi:hypothetical protein